MKRLTGMAVGPLIGYGFCALVLAGCAAPAERTEKPRPPSAVASEESLHRVGKWSMPDLSDDLSRSSLKQAVRRSLEYYARLDPGKPVFFGKDRYTTRDMQAMLQHFLKLLDEPVDGEEIKEAMRERFVAYRGGGRTKRIRYTGYYQPVLYGSRLPGLDYTVPIYRVPSDLIKADLGLFRESLKGIRIVGRYREGTLVPYHSRHEIDRLGLLNGKGYEIAWLQDPVDVFFLHIQGSGKIILPDGSVLHVHYAASNGRPYRGIGNLLVGQGAIPPEEKSMWALRKYLKEKPAEQAAVMDHNESYVFFEVVPGGPLGSLGVHLTEGRSIAMDPQHYPPGALAYIETEGPVVGEDGRPLSWEPIRRFVLVQDAGGAVKGPNRADIYWGDGEDAGARAGWMNRTGEISFFAPKSR